MAFLAVLPMEPLPLLPGSAFHDEFSPWWEPHTRGVSGQAHVVWSPGPAGGCYPFASNTALYWGLSHIEPFPGSDGGTVSHARWLRGPPSAQSQNCHDPVAPAGQLWGGSGEHGRETLQQACPKSRRMRPAGPWPGSSEWPRFLSPLITQEGKINFRKCLGFLPLIKREEGDKEKASEKSTESLTKRQEKQLKGPREDRGRTTQPQKTAWLCVPGHKPPSEKEEHQSLPSVLSLVPSPPNTLQ